MEEKSEIHKKTAKDPEPEGARERSFETLLALKYRSKFFAKLFRNAVIKFISLLLALILFLYVQYTSTHIRSVQIQVIQPDLPKELIFSRKIPSFLDLKFHGKAEQMDFDISRFQIRLENPNPQPGSNLYIAHLQPEAPPGVEAVYKKELQLFIDRVFLRELSVIPMLKINLPETHELGYISSNPRTVILRGPYETLAAMSSVETEELHVTESDDLISRRILIKKLPDFVSFAPNQPFQVELSINILPLAKDDYRLVKNVPVRCLNEIPGIQMQVAGQASVDLYLNSESQAPNTELSQVYVFCPVFFDKDTKSLRPSFLIQNQPVFSVDTSGLENAQVLKINPPKVGLQFEWTGKQQAAE